MMYYVANSTKSWFIFEQFFFYSKIVAFTYLCFVFKSLNKFIIALNRSDEFDGEYFENVSQTKSEQAIAEKRRKKIEEMQKLQEKKKEEKEKNAINDLITRRMQKFKDFGQLRKPKKIEWPLAIIRSEGYIPSNESSPG